MILAKYMSEENRKKTGREAPREEDEQNKRDQHGEIQEKDSILAASPVFAC